ncbi:MAG: T9SS type A sorting domain-containing protein [Bacteroidales bacterium]|nr:T9SS type A sorting domain-containing protein [Bacteroidales bacterium]
MKSLISIFGLLLIVFNSFSQKYYVYWENHVGFTTGPSGGSPYVTEIDQESWSVLNGCAGGLYSTPTSDGTFSIDALPKALSYDRKLRSYSVPGGRTSIQTLSFHYLHEISNLSMGVITAYNIDDNTNPGFNCSFSGLNVSGGVEIGISPPQPKSVLIKDSLAKYDVISELKRKTITLSIDYIEGDYNTTNNPKSNFTYEIQFSSNNGSTWNTICSGQPLDGTVSYTLPDVVSGFRDTLLFRSRIHRTNGVDPVAYSPWSIPKPFTVCDFPDVTITPTSPTCVGENGGTTTIQFNVGPFDPYLKYIDIFSKTTKGGETYDDTLVSLYSIKAGDTYTSLPMAAGTYTIKIRAKDKFFKIIPTTYTINQPPAAPDFDQSCPTNVCVGSTQKYSVTSVGADSYNWSFPADWTTTGTTNTATFATGSTSGNITVTPSNLCGNGSPRTLGVTVNANPTITLGAMPSVCYGSNTATIPYTATTGSPDRYSIDFDAVANNAGISDVNNATLSSNQISISLLNNLAVGTYNGTLMVRKSSAGCVSGSYNISVTVNAKPTITLGTMPSVCFGITTANLPYSTTTGTPNTYSIDFDVAANNAGISDVANTSLPSSQIPISLPNNITAGTYNGVLQVSNANGCTSNAYNISVTINDLPDIKITGSSSACSGSVGNVYATELEKTNYTWTVVGGTVTAGGTLASSSVTITWNSAGTGHVKVNYKNGNGCSAITQTDKIVTINPLPNNSFTLSDPIICNGQSATITQSGSENGFIYQLQLASNSNNVGDPVTGTGSPISYSVSPTSTSNYKVVATNNITSCSVTLTDQSAVTVNLLPTPTLAGPTITCANISGNVYQTEPSMTDYLWSVSGGTITSGGTTNSNTATVTWNAGGDAGTGVGTISVNYKNAKGCYASSDKNLNVTISNLYFNSPTLTHVKCYGGNNGAIVIVANGGSAPYTYTLKKGNTTVTTNSTGNFAGLFAASDYTVTATDINFCSVTSDNISINQPAAISILPNSITHVNCFGFNTGAISPTVTGGTNPLSYLWSGPSGYSSPSKNISGLIAGSYTIKVTDVYNCTNESTFVVLQPTSKLTLDTPSITPVSCFGDSTGQISIIASGGTSPYSYRLTGGGITPKVNANGLFTNLPAANSYSITVTDNNGCTATIGSITLTQPEQFILTVSGSNNPTCPGGSDGWVEVTVTGGTPPYSFSRDGNTWIPASSPYRFETLIAGSYTFRVKDANGCEVTTASYIVSQPDPITPTVIITNVTCKGESSGKLSLSVIGGTGLYTLTLTGPNSYSQTISNVTLAANFSGLAKGTYNLIIADAVGCTKSVDYAISEPSLPLALLTTNTIDPSCNGFTNGQVELSASGGWDSYSYTLLPNVANNSTGTFTGLGKGTYNFEVIDALGCTANVSAMLGEPDILELSTPIVTNLLCHGDGTGAISISAAGGTSPCKYNFGSGFSSQSQASNLQANTYSIIVKDSKGCVATSQATVNQPDTLQLNIYKSNHNGVNIKCFNGKDTVKVVPIGGTAPYTIAFNGQNISCPIGGYTLHNLAKGNYDITVTDSHSCAYSTSFTLTEPALFALDVIDVDSALCNGTATGKMDIALKGGIPSYSFNLLDSNDDLVSQGIGVNHLFTGLASGSYTINAVDGNGCGFTIQDIVYQPEPITVNFDVTNVSCFGYADGNAEAKITGGTIPYTCRWVGENGAEISQTLMISDAKEFNYHFLLTDKNGCSSGRGRMGQLDTLVKISNPKLPLSLSASITKVLCHGESTGEINFVGVGGWNKYSYSINGEPFYTNPRYSGLIANVYSSRIRDSLGCVVQKDFTVEQNDTLTFTTSTLDATCFGGHNGQVQISALGGSPSYTYLIDNKIFSGDTTTLGAGSYTLKVSDMYSCVVPSQTVTIGSPTQIGFSAIVINSNCNKSNGKIEVIPSGGVAPYNVDWYQGNTVIFSGNTITNQPSGLYNFRITDGNSCIKDFSHNLPDDGSPTITLNSNIKTFCPGSSDGSINLSVDQGVLPYNVYLLNGSTELDARNYPTKPSEISFTGLNENKYSVKIIDGNGCQVIEQYDVESPLQIAATATTTNIACYNGSNGSAMLTVSGGTSPYQIKWVNSSNQQIGTGASIENLSAGNYTHQVNDSHGCPHIPTNPGVSNSISINVPSAPLKASINTISNVLCYRGQDGVVQLTPQGGWGNYRFSIDLGVSWKVSPNFTKLKAGDYRFLLSDNLGCTDTIDAKVNDGTPLNINIDELYDVTCYGISTGKLTLSASGGGGSYSFSVNDGLTYTSNRYFTGLAYGVYPLRVKDFNGCEGSSKQKIEQPLLLEASINQVANTACDKSIGSATAIATGGTLPYSYRWSNGQLKNKAVNLAYGSYSVEITDKNGCKNSTTTSIQNLPGPKLTLLSKNDVTCSYLTNGSITTSLSSGTAPVILTWRGTNSSNTSINNLKKGIYTAIATDYYGCRDSVTVNIAKPDSLMISLKKQLDPLCYAYSNGILDVTSNGGTSPYTYQWSNGSRVSSTGEIPSGKYSVTVTDSKGCETKTSYTLVDPPLLKPNLPSLIVICSNQTYYADAGIPNATYQWYSENGFQSTSKTVSLSRSGIYNLLVIDSKGCSGRDTLNLVKSENIIDANFMIAEKASVGDTLVLIEMSWPIPQAIEWQYPASFMPIYQNDYSVYLVPQMVGKFNIGLTSFVGPCSESVEKAITIEPAKDRKNKPISKQSIIKDVVAYPNPNRGDFSVEIALNRESDVLVEVYSTYGKRLFARNVRGLTSYKIDINLFQTPGIYLVRITAGNEFRSLRVVVE